MISTFDLIALLLVLTALFAWINHTLIKLPHSIGLLVMGLAASFVMIALDILLPTSPLYENIRSLLRQVDFRETVLNGMLAFLLFAGALHVDLSVLRGRAWAVGIMATVGVIISTVFVGASVWAIARLIGVDLPLSWALVFGALISPTDPVAVMSTLKEVKVPESLETDMIGESLFNDGVGVVAFLVLMAIASGSGETGIADIARLFAVEAFGGAALGLVTGYVAYRAMRAIDEYGIETLISLALVTGTYALASHWHMSGPIAVVVAGILIGNHGSEFAMSDQTQRYLFGFWTLIDEILNSLLFLLIGIEVLILTFKLPFLVLGAACIPLALAGRFLSVSLPVLALRSRMAFAKGTTAVMTWGGLRGGISVALALSLPEVPEKPAILAATYAVVVFTIIVQGLTLGRACSACGGNEAGLISGFAGLNQLLPQWVALSPLAEGAGSSSKVHACRNST